MAENLRYLADYPGTPVQYAEQFRNELSAVVLPDGFTHDYSELIQRLADLIEPPTQCPYYHSERHYCSAHEDLQVIDRDALLALADEMYRNGKMQRERQKAGGHWFVDGLDVMEYARRIRKALGVQDDA